MSNLPDWRKGETNEACPDWFARLVEFHRELGHTIGDEPGFRDVELRAELIREEVKETLDAIAANDLPETIDGIIDSIYVLVGAAVTFGVDLRPIFAEVHRTNMAKAGGPRRADGKTEKPIGWSPPDIIGELRKQGWSK